jgi:hypothetical protein
LFGVKSEGSSVTDATNFEVARVHWWKDSLGVRASGRAPTGSWSFIVEGFVRSNLVVGFSEALEEPLLDA